jgi:lysozyme
MSDKKKIAAVTVLMLFILTCILAALFYYQVPNMVMARGYGHRGIDVSHYQGDIDWENIEKQGIEFAYIKATEGSS